MSEQAEHQSTEWVDEMFKDKSDVPPKYRDLLGMLASSLMGNPEAAQHFYNRAVVDGATDQELARMVDIGKSAHRSVGDVAENMKQMDTESDSQAADIAPSDN